MADHHGPMKPPISYYGGKQRMASKIVPLLPPHTVYVEPFAGGLAVMFKKGLPDITDSSHYREVINDLDSNLVNFYRVLQDPVKHAELCHRLEYTPYSREIYNDCCDALKAGSVSGIDRAYCYYIDIVCSFANKHLGGLGVSKATRNSIATFNHRKNLNGYNTRLHHTAIEHDDALKIVKRWDSPQTCFYCDPPYPSTTQAYQHKYTTDDYKAIVHALDNCKGSYVLSNYPCDIEPKGATLHEFKTTMSAARDKTVDKKRTECLWIMDRSETVPDKLKPILWQPGKPRLIDQQRQQKKTAKQQALV
jgi:DNA adenine methylase